MTAVSHQTEGTKPWLGVYTEHETDVQHLPPRLMLTTSAVVLVESMHSSLF